MNPGLLLAAAVAATAPVDRAVVQGTVRAADGSAPRLAHVTVWPPDNPAERVSIRLAPSGEYRVEVPSGTYRRLLFTAVDHEGTALLLPPLPEGARFSLHVQLALNPILETIENPKIVGSWNDFDSRLAEPMTRLPDGRFIFDVAVDADTVAYELAGVAANGHTINGPHADRFAYDGDGDYYSVLDTFAGRARITFDPNALPRGSTPASFEPDPRFPVQRRIMKLDAAIARLRTAQRAEQEGVGDETAVIRDSLDALDTDGVDPLARRYAWARRLSLLDPPTPEEARMAREALPADAPEWVLDPSITDRMIAAAPTPEEREAVARRLPEQSPHPSVRARALAALASSARERGDESAYRSLYERLKAEYGDHPAVAFDLHRLDPDLPTRTGRTVPDFEVVELGSGDTLSAGTFRGRFVMIDFWATWCGPCRAEMPNLHAAWDRFRGRGLEILSLSLDPSAERVQEYRRSKWPMPWRHAWLPGGWTDPIVERFGIRSIPMPVLVDPKGTIVASAEELRGDRLRATLDRVLPAANGD